MHGEWIAGARERAGGVVDRISALRSVMIGFEAHIAADLDAGVGARDVVKSGAV